MFIRPSADSACFDLFTMQDLKFLLLRVVAYACTLFFLVERVLYMRATTYSLRARYNELRSASEDGTANKRAPLGLEFYVLQCVLHNSKYGLCGTCPLILDLRQDCINYADLVCY